MEEINTVKRLVNLSPQEIEELENNQDKFVELAKKLIATYDRFENGKVKVGRLTTLHENIVYKINFSYRELHKASLSLREEYDSGKKDLSDNLKKMVGEFISENKERKEYRS